MKWLGVTLLAGSICMVGFVQVKGLRQRKRELGLMLSFFRGFSARIRLGRQDVCHILSALAEDAVLSGWEFLRLWRGSVQTAEDLAAAFLKTVDAYGKTGSMGEEGLGILREFASALGEGDLEEELKRLRVFEERAMRLEENAERELKEKAPLYQTLWCCLGVLGGILSL